MPDCVSVNAAPLPALTRRSLLSGAATTAATALAGSHALPASPPDPALAALGREFAQGLAAFEAAHERYCRCERHYFALRRGVRGKAARAQLRLRAEVATAEAANDTAVNALYQLMERMLAQPAHSLQGLAVKARAIKVWGQPEWWPIDDADQDVPERLAAQVLDAVIAIANSATKRD